MNVHYLKEVLTKENKYFSYRGEDCTDVFGKKFYKLLQVLLNKKLEECQTKYWPEKTCHIYDD